MLQGIGISGLRVRSVRLSLWVKAERAAVGEQSSELPGLVMHFYDSDSRYLQQCSGRSLARYVSLEASLRRGADSAASEGRDTRPRSQRGYGQADVDDVELVRARNWLSREPKVFQEIGHRGWHAFAAPPACGPAISVLRGRESMPPELAIPTCF